MSILSDHDLLARGPNLIYPFDAGRVQPASYDVLLGPKILQPTEEHFRSDTDLRRRRIIDLSEQIPDELYREIDISNGYVIYPGKFILGATMETVWLDSDIVGRIEGKSSIGRLGLTAHITAGFLDPGFRGKITLEIANLFPRPIRIWPGHSIAQISFEMLHSPCERPYGSEGLGSHYQGAGGVEGSRYGS